MKSDTRGFFHPVVKWFGAFRDSPLVCSWKLVSLRASTNLPLLLSDQCQSLNRVLQTAILTSKDNPVA